MRTVVSWFSFEGRCLLCGHKFDPQVSWSIGTNRHLDMHVREGFLNDDLEQIKPHPRGFPGPPLGCVPPGTKLEPVEKDLNARRGLTFQT